MFLNILKDIMVFCFVSLLEAIPHADKRLNMLNKSIVANYPLIPNQ